MIKDLLVVNSFWRGGCVCVISFQGDTAHMSSLPIGGCHCVLSVIYVGSQSRRENKQQHGVVDACPETIYFPFEFFYSLALQRAEICTGEIQVAERWPPLQATHWQLRCGPMDVPATRAVWPNRAQVSYSPWQFKDTLNISSPFGCIFYVFQHMW